ncbi:MAG: transposase [Bacteroidota bacterium]|nr:transposase [Bacteroidota bacterium]
MSSSYKKRFSDKGLRLQTWDYGWNAKYFVTINTKNKVEYFGEVISEAMHYSALGKLANEYWEKIPEKFSYAKLDEFIVMPNHVHGIIEIDKSNSIDTTTAADNIVANTAKIGGFAGKKNPMLYDNLSRVIRWYKGRVTYEIHQAGYEFTWQTLFHDRIIRNEQEYQRIKQYIRNNPKNWKK